MRMKQPTQDQLLSELISLSEESSINRRRMWIDHVPEEKRAVLEKLRDGWRRGDVKANLTAIHKQCQKHLDLTVGICQFSRWMKDQSDA